MNKLNWLWLSVVVIVIDQVTKYWAEHILGPYGLIPVLPVFDLSLVHNTGSAFGFLGQMGGLQHVFFVALAVVVSVVLIVFITQLKSHERHLTIAYALIIAGAIGNAIDRIIYQYVVDFIHWFYLECNMFGMRDCHYPHFNVADIAIFIGAFLMITEIFGKPFLNSTPNTAGE